MAISEADPGDLVSVSLTTFHFSVSIHLNSCSVLFCFPSLFPTQWVPVSGSGSLETYLGD